MSTRYVEDEKSKRAILLDFYSFITGKDHLEVYREYNGLKDGKHVNNSLFVAIETTLARMEDNV